MIIRRRDPSRNVGMTADEWDASAARNEEIVRVAAGELADDYFRIAMGSLVDAARREAEAEHHEVDRIRQRMAAAMAGQP